MVRSMIVFGVGIILLVMFNVFIMSAEKQTNEPNQVADTIAIEVENDFGYQAGMNEITTVGPISGGISEGYISSDTVIKGIENVIVQDGISQTSEVKLAVAVDVTTPKNATVAVKDNVVVVPENPIVESIVVDEFTDEDMDRAMALAYEKLSDAQINRLLEIQQEEITQEERTEIKNMFYSNFDGAERDEIWKLYDRYVGD